MESANEHDRYEFTNPATRNILADLNICEVYPTYMVRKWLTLNTL